MLCFENLLKIQISGSTLKWFATICMFLDHLAAAIIGYYIGDNPWGAGICIYYLLRIIGRIAFPIYCFLLTEGFLHTRNTMKYAGNLFCFALVSELPFDLALFGKSETGHQNVYFTLFLGVIVLYIFTLIDKKVELITEIIYKRAVQLGGYGITTLVFMKIANLTHCDYKEAGILVIVLFYTLRKHRVIAFTAAVIALCVFGNYMEVFALITIPLYDMYNGERGQQKKWFFYVFYPGHLVFLYFLRVLTYMPL